MGRGLLTTALLVAAIAAAASIGATDDAGKPASADRAATNSPAAEAAANGAPPGRAESAATVERGLADPTEPEKQLFTGKVVPLIEALQRRKVEASGEELEGQVVLETPAGELIPIVPDWRGRAFFQDERLRNRKVDLVGYRPAGTPYLKVLMLFTFDKDGQRQYTDYWCDICAIPMYEIQRCECCQGPVRLRFQPRGLPEYLNANPAGRAANGDDSTAAPDNDGGRP